MIRKQSLNKDNSIEDNKKDGEVERHGFHKENLFFHSSISYIFPSIFLGLANLALSRLGGNKNRRHNRGNSNYNFSNNKSNRKMNYILTALGIIIGGIYGGIAGAIIGGGIGYLIEKYLN